MFQVIVDWRYGVNPLLVAIMEHLGVPDELIKVIDEDTIIILNHPDHKIEGL